MLPDFFMRAAMKRPGIPCRQQGCPALIPYGQQYCEKHKALPPRRCGRLPDVAILLPGARRSFGMNNCFARSA